MVRSWNSSCDSGGTLIEFQSQYIDLGLPYRLEGTEEDPSTYAERVEISVPVSAATDVEATRR